MNDQQITALIAGMAYASHRVGTPLNAVMIARAIMDAVYKTEPDEGPVFTESGTKCAHHWLGGRCELCGATINEAMPK